MSQYMLELAERHAAGNGCPTCHHITERWDRETTRLYIRAQTPQSVWDDYRANGYTQHEAILMEMSYA